MRYKSPVESLEPRLMMSVAGRFVFYNNSAFDGNSPAANAADDAAVAADKVALLPGGTATFANYTSYAKGVNGVMVDLTGLTATPTSGDFIFRVGNDNNPAGWAAAPAPLGVTRRPGPGGVDRVTVVWADGAIKKQWLQVTVLANGRTNLASPDVFYFGNAVGEAGNKAADARVTPADELLARHNRQGTSNPAPVTSRYDYNRDRLVNTADELIARRNQTTTANDLNLITVPAAPSTRPASVALDFTASRNDFGQLPMGTAETAGVVPQQWWTSTPQPAEGQSPVSGTLNGLRDNTGAVTSGSVTYASPNNYSNRYPEGHSGDYRMMDGYLDPTPQAPATVTFSSLPFSGTYDVYVYADGDSRDNWRVGTYAIGGAASGNATVSKGDPLQNRDDPRPQDKFVYDEGGDHYALVPAGGQAGDRNPVRPVGGGNYLLFRGVSGSTFTLTATPNAQLTASAGGDLARAPVNGIQIVGRVLSSSSVSEISNLKSQTAAESDRPPPTASGVAPRQIAFDPLSIRNNVEPPDGPDGQQPLAPGDIAGVGPVRQGRWNPLGVDRSFGNYATRTGFAESDGRASPITLTHFADTNFSVNFREGLSPDHRMMDGYFDTGAFFGDVPTIFAFTDVPFATYDVYVYADGSNHPGQNDRHGVYTLSTTPANMPTPQSVRKYDTPVTENSQNGSSTFAYDDATSDGNGNYLVFRNVTGPRFTLTATPVAGGNPRASVNGIQIVEVPAAVGFTRGTVTPARPPVLRLAFLAVHGAAAGVIDADE